MPLGRWAANAGEWECRVVVRGCVLGQAGRNSISQGIGWGAGGKGGGRGVCVCKEVGEGV